MPLRRALEVASFIVLHRRLKVYYNPLHFVYRHLAFLMLHRMVLQHKFYHQPPCSVNEVITFINVHGDYSSPSHGLAVLHVHGHGIDFNIRSHTCHMYYHLLRHLWRCRRVQWSLLHFAHRQFTHLVWHRRRTTHLALFYGQQPLRFPSWRTRPSGRA